MRNRVISGFLAALMIGGTVVSSSTPAAAWCRWGRCGGWGWGGPVAAGVVAGTVVGAAAAAAARPYPYYAPGGYYACPPGYHFGPRGSACWLN